MGTNNKRQKILHAAQEIFSEKGLKDATITEIAGKAGVVDSIIYHYFKNKEDLLFCALDQQMKTAIRDLRFNFKGIMGAVSKLGKMVWYHLHSNDFNQGDIRIRKHLLLECRGNQNFYKHKSYHALKEYAGVLMGILKEGVEEGVFQSDLNVAIARDMIFGLLDEESLSCLASRELTETTPDFEHIMSLILSMVAKQPAKKEPLKKPDKAKNVLKAATKVFAQKGFNKASMVDVGNGAAVAEGTIYEYYINKQDLLLSISKEQFKKYKIELDQTFDLKDPLAKLTQLIRNHFLILTSNIDFLVLFLNDIKLNKHFYNSDSYNYFINYFSKLSEVLGEGKRAGIFRPDVHNRVYRNLFIGSMTHLLMRWCFISTPPPLMFMSEFNQATELLCRAAMAE